MTMIYKKTAVLALVFVGIMVTSFAMAASKIEGGKHDFTSSGTSIPLKDSSNALPQTCIYCHTPHNAGQARLLWNKDVKSATAFRLYTSSGSLTSITKKSTLGLNSPSLLCLSCHDGKTAMNVLHSGGQGTAAPVGYPAGSKYAFGSADIIMPGSLMDMFSGSLTPNMAIGRGANEADNDVFPIVNGDNLTDDHPIGFSYTAVRAERAAGLMPITTPETAGIRFFGTDKIVECSTCHDPHVNTNPAKGGDSTLAPFLVMSNSGSALCLKCHDK